MFSIGPSIVADATRQRVLEAVESTGFIRNTQAYQLRGGRSHTVGVVVLDVSNPFFTEMFRGAESSLQAEGYVLMLASTDDSVEREASFVRAMEEHRVEGILITPAAADLGSLAGLKTRGVPTVLLDRKATADEFCSVTVDDVRGGELAARHLFDTGHRRHRLRERADHDSPVPGSSPRGAQGGAGGLQEHTL